MAAFVTGLQEGSHDSPKHEMMWYPIVISLGVGIAILGLWSMLLARRQVPEVRAGLASMRFHLAAEVLTGAAHHCGRCVVGGGRLGAARRGRRSRRGAVLDHQQPRLLRRPRREGARRDVRRSCRPHRRRNRRGGDDVTRHDYGGRS